MNGTLKIFDKIHKFLNLKNTSLKVITLIYSINYILLSFVHYTFILQYVSKFDQLIEFLRTENEYEKCDIKFWS